MPTSFEAADIATLLREADQIPGDVTRTLGALSAAQINWKPDAREWGVGQCLDHLIIATSAYFPLLRSIQAGTWRPGAWTRVPGLPGFWARTLLRMLQPDGSQRASAPPAWRPASSDLDPQIVARFLACHAELADLMRATSAADLGRVISSPAAAFVTYTLLDAYRIIITHQRLHLGQAERVLQQPGFPGRA